MKPILEWLNEAKAQGCEWADAAIRNYDPNYEIIKETKNLSSALIKDFSWRKSPEDSPYWNRVYEILKATSPITPVTQTSLDSLIEDLGKLNKALENLERNETLKEPYRTRVFKATKASYEEQLAEVKVKIAKMLGIEPIKERKLIGGVVQGQDGGYYKYTAPVVTKDNRGWAIPKFVGWSGITTEEAAALCGRLPKLSDDEPTPIYE